MKTTVVPAQVTTVEDKVAGNLSFTQLMLLTAPIFIDGMLFGLFPPIMKLTALKLTIGGILMGVSLLLAIRIRGKLLLEWITITSRYNLRPKYYIYNKNDTFLRFLDAPAQALEQVILKPTMDNAPRKSRLSIPIPEMVRLESSISDPKANFHLRARKGGLRVYIREVKEESI